VTVEPSAQGDKLAWSETSTRRSRLDDRSLGPISRDELNLTIRSFYEKMKFISPLGRLLYRYALTMQRVRSVSDTYRCGICVTQCINIPASWLAL